MNLAEWQSERLRMVHAGRTDYGKGLDDVTVFAYHFWSEDGYDEAFSRVECAIRETWLHCGSMRTVLAVNCVRPCVERFAAAFPCVDVQGEESP